ncbi:hypothetical protein BC830DRAFT_1229291 [Chytriomyces sp. MP71]|nr:hypothetical protein BC830DRAFT_1229291 [Chytriomyces sp. MP71]
MMLKPSKSTSIPHLPTYNTPAALPSLQNALKGMGTSSSSLFSHPSTTARPSLAKTDRKRSTVSLLPHRNMTSDTIEHGSTQKRGKNESVETFLRRVTHVSLVGKGIEVMEGLDFCRNLTVLYLYENNIKKIEGLNACVSLNRLYLQHNQIEELSGFDAGLEKLAELHLAGNRIKYVTGIHQLPSLEVLHVDDQHIEEELIFDIACVSILSSSLKVLTAAGNHISRISTLAELAELEELDISRNNVSELEEVQHVLRCCLQLRNLNMNGNPASSILKFRQKAILASSSLETLGEKDIPAVEREFLINMQSSKQRLKLMKAKGQTGSAVPNDPNAPQIFALTMLGNPEHGKPIPHLPPYASQYRDLMLHNIALQGATPRPPPPMLRAQRGARVARAAEDDVPKPLKLGFPVLPPMLAEETGFQDADEVSAAAWMALQREQLAHHEQIQYQYQMQKSQPDWPAMNSSSAASVFGSTVHGRNDQLDGWNE